MRWLLGDVDWSLRNNRIHCSSGASRHANGLGFERPDQDDYAKSLVHWVLLDFDLSKEEGHLVMSARRTPEWLFEGSITNYPAL
jgi:hypothetical protein